MTQTSVDKHEILIIGGGSAGLTLAARLRRAGEHDIAMVEPSGDHYYQPLWTLVGGGRAPLPISRRDEAGLIPVGVRWVQDRAVQIDPAARTVTLGSGARIGYRVLAVCPGIQLDWDQVPGLAATLGMRGVSGNYRADLAPKTWEFLRDLPSGTAVFSLPAGPVKCPARRRRSATWPPTGTGGRGCSAISIWCSSCPPRSSSGCPSSPGCSSRWSNATGSTCGSSTNWRRWTATAGR